MSLEAQLSSAVLSARQKVLNTFVIAIAIVLLVPFLLKMISNFTAALSQADSLSLIFKQVYWYLHQSIKGAPVLVFSLPIIFLLQRFFPAVEKQSSFNQALALDALYSVVMLLFYIAVAPSFFDYLKVALSISEFKLWAVNASELHYFWQLLIGYLAVDFLGWLHHLIRHKVPFFWALHAVHHSQQELNPLSNERIHILDWFVANMIKFIPVLFFTESLGIILNYIVIHKFLDHLNHANVKTNLGFLRYVFVTPQSHRVHHSCEKEFFDKNFGVSLSIWDHIFGTQCKNYDVYPATGVPDSKFPNEQNAESKNILVTFFSQQAYPFKKIARYLGDR